MQRTGSFYREQANRAYKKSILTVQVEQKRYETGRGQEKEKND